MYEAYYLYNNSFKQKFSVSLEDYPLFCRFLEKNGWESITDKGYPTFKSYNCKIRFERVQTTPMINIIAKYSDYFTTFPKQQEEEFWISVESALPPKDEFESNVSIEVKCKTRKGEIENCFFFFEELSFRDIETEEVVENVEYWRIKRANLGI